MADQIIDIPGVGHVAFPDSMSASDIESASAKLYKEHGGTVTPKDDRSAGQRFVEGAASQLNPVAAIKGIAQTVAHPIDTLGSIVQSHIDQAKKAKAAYDEGRYSEAAGHLGAAALPVVGPAAAGIGERIAATGDIATGVGEGAGLVASLGVPKAIPAVASAVGRTGAAVGRAGQAVGEAASAALEHPIAQAVAQKAVKHGSTVAGAALGGSVGGGAGAFLGGTAGRAFGASIAERMAAKAAGVAEKAPVAASQAETAAELASGRPMGAADYIEKLNSLTPEQKQQVVAARQTSAKAAPKAETPAELTARVSAEHRAQYLGPEAPRSAAPEQVGPVPQTAPVVEPAPPVPAEPAATAPPNVSDHYLHGSAADLTEFQRGAHGATYLSPTKGENILPGRKTQAEHIASGPFGGKLYRVSVDESKIKAFDPLNDAKAQEIYTSVIGQPSKNGLMPYPDMPAIVKAAEKEGYNSFRVHEPSVQGVSRAITDPSALKIIDKATGPDFKFGQSAAEAPKSFNPSTAYDAARKAFADAGETPKAGELSWITEYVRRGLSVKEAVKKVIETRKTVPSSADPAAELAAKLGTPSPAAVEEAVRARNATGRWAAR